LLDFGFFLLLMNFEFYSRSVLQITCCFRVH